VFDFELFKTIVFSEPKLWLYIGVFLLIVLIYHGLIQLYYRYRLKKSGINDIDKMKGRTFEEYLRVLYQSHGYHVTLTPSSGDYGADLVLKKEGATIVVQVKRYAKNVGVKAVQEVVGAKEYYHATRAWVVTNRGYTGPAIKLAKANQVKLIGRDQLISQMIVFNKKQV